MREDGKGGSTAREVAERAASLTYAIPNDSALFSALVKMRNSKFSIPGFVGPPVELH